jgi:hypothetical protein
MRVSYGGFSVFVKRALFTHSAIFTSLAGKIVRSLPVPILPRLPGRMRPSLIYQPRSLLHKDAQKPFGSHRRRRIFGRKRSSCPSRTQQVARAGSTNLLFHHCQNLVVLRLGRGIHGFQYRDPEKFRRKRILVAGCVNSALEIATDLAILGVARVVSTFRRQRLRRAKAGGRCAERRYRFQPVRARTTSIGCKPQSR